MTTTKGDGEIRQKLKQVKFRHLKRELEHRLRTAPENCTHNKVLVVDGRQFGFCGLKQFICDGSSPATDHSGDCPDFGLCRTKDEIKDAFHDLMASPVHEIAVKYPDVAALTWVVGNDGVRDTDPMPGSTLVGSFKGVLLWADSVEDAQMVSSEIGNLIGVEGAVAQALAHVDSLESDILNLTAKVNHAADQLDDVEKQSKTLDQILRDISERLEASTVVSAKIVERKRSFMDWFRSWR